MKKISLANLSGLFAYAGFYEFIKLFNCYLIMRAFNIDVSLIVVITLGAMVMLASELPISFLGLGTREAAVILLFAKYAPPETLLAAGLLFSFIEYILPNLVCLPFTKGFLDRMLNH